MTISYQRDVASSTAGGFTRLLFKWKGSLYKLIYRELLLFMSAYILLSLVYRQLLTQHQRGLFEMVVKYFDAFLNLIPLSFVLGFYVSYVASRWWQQFLAIPWPDKLFHSVACFVDGFDQESRMLRRSLMRYMNLALILVLRSISSAVKQRFPTLEHVVEAGFMTNQEKELFQAVPCNEFNTYWIPCTWFIYRLQEASKKGKLLNDYALETIMREFCEFRAKCGLLWCYDWVSIPMVYTQVVTLATYVFFIFTVIGRQKIDTLKKGEYMRSGRMPMDIDLYIPVYTVLQFFFYMGLLKVAEQLINPFGDDDEDFELNWLVDRHMKASFLGCDILMDPDRIPPMVKDYYWDKQNCPIPYTEASMHFKRKTYKGSADDMIVPESKQHMVLPEIEEEEEDLNQRHSKLSLTSLLLESTQVVTGASMGLAGFGAGYGPKSSSIVTKIGLGNSGGNSAGGRLENSLAAVADQHRLSLEKGRESGNGILPHPPTPDMFEVSSSPLPQGGTRAFHGMSWRNGSASASNSVTPQPPPSYPTAASGTSRANEILSASTSNLSNKPSSLLRRGSDSSLPTSLLWGQQTSVESTDEDDRSSIGATVRRGSKLLDFLDKKTKKPVYTAPGAKRYKDKHGFVWRRMVPNETEDLPRPRAPHLGHGATPWLYHSEGSTPLPSLISVTSTVITDNPLNLRKISAPSDPTIDNTSLTSFKTCPSDSNLVGIRSAAPAAGPPVNNVVPLPVVAVQRPKISLPTPTSIPQPQNPEASNENVIAGVRHLVRE